MKNQLLYVCIGLFILALAACSDDDGNLAPSLDDKDWWEIKDNPDSKLDHLIYEVYKETGVSIFYNDTIGREVRVDNFGNTYNYYKIIDIEYNIEGRSVGADYVLSTREQQIEEGVKFLRDRVIHRLISGTNPRCFLLVDYLRLNPNAIYESCIREGSVYRSMEATVVGKLNILSTLSEEGLNRMAAEVLAAGVANYVFNHESTELEQFYNLSTLKSGDDIKSMYGQYLYSWNSDYEIPEYYGFLSSSWYNEEDEDMYMTPLHLQDIVQYITEVMVGDDEGFMQKYAEYEVVRKKFRIMQKIIVNLQSRKDLE